MPPAGIALNETTPELMTHVAAYEKLNSPARCGILSREPDRWPENQRPDVAANEAASLEELFDQIGKAAPGEDCVALSHMLEAFGRSCC